MSREEVKYSKIQGNDMIAVGLIKGLSKIKHLKSLVIIGFDGIRLGEGTTDKITTLCQPIDAIASQAIEMIIKNRNQIHKVFEGDLLIREI